MHIDIGYKIVEEDEENLRFKFVSGIDRQPKNLTIFQNVHIVELNQVEMMCYFLFSNANWIVSSPRKVQDFGAPKFIFKPRAFAFLVSHERKNSGDENTSSFGTRTSL